MRKLKLTISFLLLFTGLFSQTPLKYNLALTRNHDLSDSYGGGTMLSGELKLSKSWYGASIGYGYLQSLSYVKFDIYIEEIDKTLNIRSPELANVQDYSLSIILIPILKKWFSTEISFGIAYAQAKKMNTDFIEYGYDLNEDKFTYIKREYYLSQNSHFGYQAGFNLCFKVYKPLGIKLHFSLQDLNDATFVFAGYGIDFTF